MEKKYYLGLDIGTDSVGYAVTDEYYQLMKFKGEPVWGVHTFDEAMTSAERRSFRTARRRIDRRQHRVALLNEIFAAEISKIDPKFFIRRAESSLFRDETEDAFTVFADSDYTDKEYYDEYPTVHHLICELMKSKEPHDIRLVYIACAWLVAHRGHFLFDVPAEDVDKLLKFETVFNDFTAFFTERDSALPWNDNVSSDDIQRILTMKAGVKRKQDAFKADVFGGKNPPKTLPEEYAFQYSPDALVRLLSGAKVKPADLLPEQGYEDVDSVSLSMDDTLFAEIVSALGEDGELLVRARALADCSLLLVAKNGKDTISEAKVEVYEQHGDDLKKLKAFVKKYIPKEYNSIFRDAVADNYVAYSLNVKDCKDAKEVKSANIENFYKFLKKKVGNVAPDKKDEAFFEDMMQRIDAQLFLPKQKTTDNRVIPQQLYRYELKLILDNAEAYLPMLSKKDESGLTAKEKTLSIFDFRIPYFIGPLCSYKNPNSWMVRKAEGKIYPWNFKDLVDYDKSEEAFIRRMTNTCSYLAGEPVLPAKSLLYTRFTVLNEINNLKINGNPIPVEIKQRLFDELFVPNGKATLKQVKDWFKANGLLFSGDEITGVDIKINSSLPTYRQFNRLLSSGTLSHNEVERIIERAAFSEDKVRLQKWLAKEYPQLSEADRKYISGLNLKEFGRLSEKLLNGIIGCDRETGEAFTIIEALWNTNANLMQLLSSKYTFKDEIEKFNAEYYADHPKKLSERLDDMYISNSVKRPIIRTMAICADVVKAMGCQPERIFIEMARGASPEQKGQRTKTRLQQLKELYKTIRDNDAREMEKQLDGLGQMADNMLQGDKLFLYFMQMGKCAYTGRPIDLDRLATRSYDIDHIYPQSFVKDDSILNNKVLVESEANGAKSNSYPVPAEFRSRMRPVWDFWLDKGLITKEKHMRLTRTTGFTDEEKMNFINRQLVETRQSTKAVAELLKEKYPEAETVYVKAGLVSEFRQEYGFVKSRQINNLHHAKDAYLNIVCGNVYHCRFSRQWFNVGSNYSLNTKAIYGSPVKCGKSTVWQGETDLAKIRAVMNKNAVHVTRYAFCRKGGLFDQQPVKAGPDLVPLKAELNTERYGGYRKPAAAFFSLVRYTTDKKTDVMFMPVELMFADKYLADVGFAKQYATETISSIFGNPVREAEILLDGRPLKINTILSADGLRLAINGKSGGGKQTIVSLAMPLILGLKEQKYIKALESFDAKRKSNPSIIPDAGHDHITAGENVALYDTLYAKMKEMPYKMCPGNQADTLLEGREQFIGNDVCEQVSLLLSVILWFSSASAAVDLSSIGGSKKAGSKYPASNLSSWGKTFASVKIVDSSASGLYETESMNLLSLL